MLICGYQKTTLLDYPGHLASTVFTGSCNFACPFCHNRSLVLHPDGYIPEEEFFSFLVKRKNILTGVCISGGEPTLQPDLISFIRKIREFDLLIKLDTNGYRPDVIEELLQLNLLDYIAMDIKSGCSHYSLLAGIDDLDLEKIKKSISLIEHSGIAYEFRTTVVKDYHTAWDFEEISQFLSPQSPYFLQSFKDSGNILTPGLSACSSEELNAFLSLVKRRLPKASLRGGN
ncbi:MAG: anaerobic ribonucleoside-triphosphate reductase activating protein [Lachnospiraceae bacterium]|nr:anaerobic ribonucleoside-triphosphate reductase activating protein [Lachnospiraceae bacterium]